MYLCKKLQVGSSGLEPLHKDQIYSLIAVSETTFTTLFVLLTGLEPASPGLKNQFPAIRRQ